jgi:hypothetical protein
MRGRERELQLETWCARLQAHGFELGKEAAAMLAREGWPER